MAAGKASQTTTVYITNVFMLCCTTQIILEYHLNHAGIILIPVTVLLHPVTILAN